MIGHVGHMKAEPRQTPELAIFELCRDRYWSVCSTKLLAAGKPILRPAASQQQTVPALGFEGAADCL
jgi:hypothetical protein